MDLRMPRFAANLAFLFTERPLIERFASAAAAGFRAVELQVPYDLAPSAVKAELDRHAHETHATVWTTVEIKPEKRLLGSAPRRGMGDSRESAYRRLLS